MPSYQGADMGVYTAEVDPNVGVTYDRVPKGEVEIRRSSVVESSDGHELALGARVHRRRRCDHRDRLRVRPPLAAPHDDRADRLGGDAPDERDRHSP